MTITMSEVSITCRLYLRVNGLVLWRMPLRAQLSYVPRENPYAVCLTFLSYPDQDSWWIDRDAFSAAFTRHVGKGSVRLGPLPGGRSPHLVISLRCADGEVNDLVVGAGRALEFLAETFELVPSGTESSALEAGLDDFLGRAS
ncbi:SsgA family sporulation/cell division regulator (plasmid) [Nonomuraea sp. NBC_00507]|uniref:SsgA family sporulation/cell division regulator n=1 Tax=Nonomuraea sp. NBC_00507 TaxID=2976002 RepID=UPI002E189856